jgi:hypothetical protein
MLGKLHSDQLHDLNSSWNISRVVKSRKMKWAGHVARMGETRNAYKILVGKPEWEKAHGRHRLNWEDNIKIGLRGRV